MTTVRLQENEAQYEWVVASAILPPLAESESGGVLISEQDFLDIRLAAEAEKDLREKGPAAFTSYDQYRQRRGLGI